MAEKPKSGKENAGAKTTERILIIPLRAKARRSAKNKRMNRSVKEIRAFVSKHMAADIPDVSISQQLNESIWRAGFHNPPASVKVRAAKDEEGKVRVSLLDEKPKPKKEKKRSGIRERLRRKASETPSSEDSGRKEESQKEDKPKETKKADKPTEKKPEAKPEHKAGEKKEKPAEKEPAEEIEQDIRLEQ